MKLIKISQLLIVCLVIVASGCATSPSVKQSTFTAATVKELEVGASKSQVLATLGEPRSRSVDSNSNEVWQYRKNAQQGKGMKTFANITSFGLTSNVDAEFQDILTVTFKSDVVSEVGYQENVRMAPFGGIAGH